MLLDRLPIIMIECLLSTIIIECIIGYIIGIRNKKDILNITLVNIMTNPIVVSFPVYLMIRYSIGVRNISLLILEILAVLVEGFTYSKVLKYKKINPFIISLILNLGSYLIGEVINVIIY